MNVIQRLWAAGLIVAAMGAGGVIAWAGELVLVQDARPAAVIVIPDRGDPGAVGAASAAKVLSDHLFQMSGARLEIRSAADLGKATMQEGYLKAETGKVSAEIQTYILVGESSVARQAGLSNKELSAGGILVKTQGNVLGLIGAEAPGDLQANTYAVVEFLESRGCRYLWPGESGKVIPHRSTVRIAALDRRFSPPVQQRRIRAVAITGRPEIGLSRLGLERPVYESAYKKAVECVSPITWSQWHRLGGSIGIDGGAAGAGLRGGWKEYGQSHPEWFALQMDGSRDQSTAADRWRLCVSNPSLIEHVANDIIQRARENPRLTCVSLCPNDGGLSSFCLCEECRKLDPRDAPRIKLRVYPKTGEKAYKDIESPALTDRYVHYWNAIADRVTKVHPDLLFLCEAYSVYSTPPVREKLHPNLVIRYVPGSTDGWTGWQKAGTRRIYWRPNTLLAGKKDGMGHVMVDILARDMKYFADNGMLATDFDSIGQNWATQGLNYYATARLCWDPHLTAAQILDEYCQGFGPAAAPVRQYFQQIQRLTLSGAPIAVDERRIYTPEKVYTPEKLAELRGLLDAAEKAGAGDQALLERLAFLRLGLNHTELFATLNRLCASTVGRSELEVKAIKAKAQPLLALNYLALRDIVRNHNLAVNASFLVWNTSDFAHWEAIGGRAYRPSDATIALGDDPARTLTGRENSIEAMQAALGLTGADVAALSATRPAAQPESTTVDADENGRPVEVLQK